ncbi:uncharacterized protein LOC120540733 [Polypterus senegalus]|uniref:uncharacterized protein LOC120540733 n=1 Tax=Polypterus senegalus TaxID=55291 RepID=UPI001964DB23|nr:uncharacterized protein LOC120540733 [Polypterus senegalus]XP_039627689.1 uncharacterized protein LOC120540733 [Polypterus senegalus]
MDSDTFNINEEGSGIELETTGKEDTDIFSYLSNEERECLNYLMDTIDSLEMELMIEEKEKRKENGSTFTCHPEEHMEIPSPADVQSQKLTVEDNKHNFHHQMPASYQQDTSSSINFECLSPRSSRSTNMQCAQTRKFDTILRSGVSVQELRAQVLARFNGSVQEDACGQQEPTHSTTACFPDGLDLKSSRAEALQRLGFGKRSQSLSQQEILGDLPISQLSSADQTLGLIGQDNSHSLPYNSTDRRSSIPRSPSSVTDKDHHEALKKLGLLKL